MDAPPLVIGRDYYTDPDGRYVFTAAYLLARGHCCHSGCRHCPYGYRRDERGGRDERATERGRQPGGGT